MAVGPAERFPTGDKLTRLGYPELYGSRPTKLSPKPPPKGFKTTYKFKVSRIYSAPPIGGAMYSNLTTEPEVLWIQGRVVRSKNEYYLYQAFLLMGLTDMEINYQVPWHGGRALGGQDLDFVVTRGGASSVFRVMGQYWHPGEYGTPLDIFTKAQMLSEGFVVHDIPDYELPDAESAIAALKKRGFI